MHVGIECGCLCAQAITNSPAGTLGPFLDRIAAHGFDYVILNSYACDTPWRHPGHTASQAMKTNARDGLMVTLMLAALFPVAEARAAENGVIMSEFIFDKAPFPSCHASTIAETRDGLVAAWFGGTQERNPDVCIWLSRHQDGHWSPPEQVADGIQAPAKRLPCWNPVLFQPKDGPLLLFYKVGPSPAGWWGMLKTSADGGRTWSEARRLPDGILGPVKNKPVQLGNGALLCGSSTERGGWRVHFEFTTDLGQTWKIIRPPPDDTGLETIQPSILFHGPDELQAVGRTGQNEIFETWSCDGGKTWGKLVLTDLPNPNSGIDAVTLRDGRQLLVYNHSKTGRSPLNVAVSSDGKIWQAALVLEDAPRQEFSYPAVIQTRDGLVHIVYTWHRQRVKHVVLDPAKLELKRMDHGQWPPP